MKGREFDRCPPGRRSLREAVFSLAMKEGIQSSVFGDLRLDEELPEHPAYTTELPIEGHGTVSITLAAMPNDQLDWSSFLRAAEESHSLILRHEQAIRQQAAPQVLSTHRAYYEHE